jgi:hypothetical protein
MESWFEIKEPISLPRIISEHDDYEEEGTKACSSSLQWISLNVQNALHTKDRIRNELERY